MTAKGGKGGGEHGYRRSLIQTKDSKMEKFDKTGGWKSWKADFEVYVEEMFNGMRDALGRAKTSEDEADDITVNEDGSDRWSGKKETLWRFLRIHTDG